MRLKCIMPTCGKEIDSDKKRCVCVCGNWMWPKPEERIRKVKKVQNPDQEVNHEPIS